MTKQDQFITEVQTGIIIRSILDNHPDARHKALWPALISMDDAFYASTRIPEKISAHEAACQFLEFVFEDKKGESYQTPTWFLKY